MDLPRINVVQRSTAALLLAFACSAAMLAQSSAPSPAPTSKDPVIPAQAPATTPAATPAQTPDAAGQTAAPPANGAQQPQASGNGSFTLRTFVPEVDLVFTVTDGKGHFVTGLKQSDLGLLDDGKRPDRVIS